VESAIKMFRKIDSQHHKMIRLPHHRKIRLYVPKDMGAIVRFRGALEREDSIFLDLVFP
jgi:hypothetical protein